MVILTQNIWGGAPFWSSRRRALARRIAALRPDLVGLQEVQAPGPHGGHSQAHELCLRLEGYTAEFQPARLSPTGPCEGVALLSRHPIHARSAIALSQDRADRLDRISPRVVLHARVEGPGGPLDVLVTHLSLSRRARARTARELLGLPVGDDVVLLGDLNATPGDPALAALEDGGWLDAWKSSRRPNARGGTWPSLAPCRRIDYIFIRRAGRWRVLGCEREPLAGSDHRGVSARLEWDRS